MQALPIVQSAPQNQDISAQPSSASSSGSDFKTMLQSSASKSSEPNSKAGKSGDNKDSQDKAAQDNAPQGTQQLVPPTVSLLEGMGIEKKLNHTEKKPDTKKDAQTDASALPTPLVAANIPMQQNGKPAAKSASDTPSVKSVSLENAMQKSGLSAQGKAEAKPADIAQTGNNLPPKDAKIPLAMTEKHAMPEASKTSDNPISLQPATASQEAKSIPKLKIDAPVSSPQWGNEIGQKVAWMSSSGNHVAELHLNPPNLGPVEVKLTINNDQASIQFVAQHQETRTALESALPKLKEMMMDSGISLGNASVNSGSSQQQSGFSQQDQSRQQSVFPVAESSVRMSRSIVSIGNIDTFA